MPEDWREWASSDPAEHPPGCACLCEGHCCLELDAYNYQQSVQEPEQEA